MDQHSCTSFTLIIDWRLSLEAEQTTLASLQRPVSAGKVTKGWMFNWLARTLI